MKNQRIKKLFLAFCSTACLLPGLLKAADLPADGTTAPAVVDVKRADAAQAIINYQAELAEKDRLRTLVQAPGTSKVAQTIDSLSQYQKNASVYSSLLTNLNAVARRNATFPSGTEPRVQYFQSKATNPANADIATLLQNKNLSTSDLQSAAQQAILNITQPFPSPMSPDLSNKLQPLAGTENPEANLPSLSFGLQAEYVERVVSQSVYSAAREPLYQMLANRLPIPNDPNQRSLLETLEQESSWRATSPQWLSDLSVTPKEGVLRELAQMEAIRLWLQYQQYRQAEEIQTLLSALLSSQNRLTEYLQKTLQEAEVMKQQNAGV